jgi:hypothetical protein
MQRVKRALTNLCEGGDEAFYFWDKDDDTLSIC